MDYLTDSEIKEKTETSDYSNYQKNLITELTNLTKQIMVFKKLAMKDPSSLDDQKKKIDTKIDYIENLILT